MSRARIATALPEGSRILLDSTALIAHLDGSEAIAPVATLIIDEWVASGRNEATISMISVMECLIQPLRRSLQAHQHVLDFLQHTPNFRLQPIDLFVAQEAATIRAAYDFSPPDALVIASGLIAQVAYLVTNDAAWQQKLGRTPNISSRIKVVDLKQFTATP